MDVLYYDEGDYIYMIQPMPKCQIAYKYAISDIYTFFNVIFNTKVGTYTNYYIKYIYYTTKRIGMLYSRINIIVTTNITQSHTRHTHTRVKFLNKLCP